MKRLYLYSTRDSVLKHWLSGISRVYELVVFKNMDALYDALDKQKPSAVLFDYGGEMETIGELLLYLRDGNDTKVMAFNSKPVYTDGLRLIKEGVKALLNVYASSNNINQAVKAVLGGNIWLYPEFIQMMIRQTTVGTGHGAERLDGLSARERELAEMVALGMSNKEIAQLAGITEQTVKTHFKTMYEKLDVTSRLELAILVNNLKHR